MKNLIAKIKDLNFKELVIDHAEKGVLGLIGLLVVISLLKTEWVPYDKQPEEFVTKAESGTTALRTSTWPDDKRIALEKPKDVSGLVGELLTDVRVDRYEFLTPYFFDLYPRKEKIREPEWLAIEDLEVTSGKVILAISPARFYAPEPDETELAANDDTSVKPAEKDDPDGDLARRTARPKTATPQATATPAKTTGGSGRGLGFRYVAVRGIFPLKDQIDKLAAALNESSLSKTNDIFDLINFELERQAAVSDANPWSEPWEKVDVAYALRVLRNVEDFDTEVVDHGLTDSVITMPLPARLAGFWRSRGSHPRISQLDEEQREAQRLEDEQLMEEYRKQQEKEQKKQPVRKGGFASQVENVRKIRSNIFGGAKGQQLRKKIRQETKMEGVAANASATIVGRLLLFRFFDFTVEPGNAYRYRVRLVIRNPNYERPIEELMDAAFAQGETRITSWSEPSGAAIVERDVNYFVTKVDPPRGPSSINVTMNVYQWYQEAGTTIKGELKKIEPGQFIAAFREEKENNKGDVVVSGGVETLVLRPASEKYGKEENIEISTGDVLVDIDDAPKIDPALHPDLQIESRRGPQIADQILSVNRYGELIGLDTFTSASGDLGARNSLAHERGPWEYIRDRAKENENKTGLDRALDDKKSKRELLKDKIRKRKNSTRKSGG